MAFFARTICTIDVCLLIFRYDAHEHVAQELYLRVEILIIVLLIWKWTEAEMYAPTHSKA